MKVRYDKLWRLMKDNKMKKSDLAKAAELSPYTMTKLNKDRPVNMEVMMNLCKIFHYDIGEVETPFDGLMAFSDASALWGLHESTLRKAIAYGKLVNGVDVCKFGKQWVVSVDAMVREYGSIAEE